MNDSTNNILRQIIKETLLQEQSGPPPLPKEITVGMIKAALQYAKGKKLKDAAKEASKEAGKKGLKLGFDALVSLIPGGAFISSAVESGMELKDLYSAAKSVDPDAKKQNPLWDMLTIDPDSSAIVDDAVEADFVKAVAEKINELPDETKLPDIDRQLANYLKKKFSGAYVNKS
jgi:hypothetical protein